MKKIILSLVLVISIVMSGCSFQLSDKTRGNEDKSNVRMKESNMENVSFTGLNDPEIQSYVEENVYQSVLKNIDTNEYFVENVQAVYISQEYIDDLTYNSQSNVFFGYTLADLDMEFEGEKYVFNVDDNGKTKVELFEEYDDTYEQIIKNVAIGTGVILICVTVSVITAGADAPAIAYIFAGAAKSGTGFALSSAAIGGTASSAITYAKTGNVDLYIPFFEIGLSLLNEKDGSLVNQLRVDSSMASEKKGYSEKSYIFLTPGEYSIRVSDFSGGNIKLSVSIN